MKKVFSFFAMIALVGMMVACGGSDKPGKDGVTAKNEIKEGDSDVLKMVKITDQLLNIMEQEPSAEGYEMMMNTSMKMASLNMEGISEEEINKVAADFDSKYADEKAMEEKMKSLQGKWDKWAEEHQEEAQAIAMKAFGAMMAAMPMPSSAPNVVPLACTHSPSTSVWIGSFVKSCATSTNF